MGSNAAPRALLFDLDSALISRGLSLMRFGERFAAHFANRLGGVSARGVAYGLSEVDGNGFRSHAELADELRDLFPWSDKPSQEELTAYWDEVFPQCAAPDPEAPQTLRWLRAHGYALGVVAHGAPEMQRAKIAAVGFGDLFAVTLFSMEMGLERSDARLYQFATGALGVAPELVWMVSALQEDCLTARDAGLGAIFLQRVFYWQNHAEPPTHEIPMLGELVPLLENDASGGTR